VRGLVLALLFLNLAFLAWVEFVGEPSRRPAAPDAGPPIPRLRLAAESGAVTSAPRCTSIGPFADQAIAERAVLWLRGERREPRLRSTRRDGGTGYWVMLDTPTLQQAARVSMRLRAAGVADVEVVPPAQEATRAVVSLGIYADRANADRRVDELRKYAVSPQVVEQPRTDTIWWIDVDVGGAGPVDVGALERAVQGATGLVGETCPAVALPSTPSATPATSTSPSTPTSPTAAEPPDARKAFG
jgi:hypothetical protein